MAGASDAEVKAEAAKAQKATDAAGAAEKGAEAAAKAPAPATKRRLAAAPAPAPAPAPAGGPEKFPPPEKFDAASLKCAKKAAKEEGKKAAEKKFSMLDAGLLTPAGGVSFLAGFSMLAMVAGLALVAMKLSRTGQHAAREVSAVSLSDSES